MIISNRIPGLSGYWFIFQEDIALGTLKRMVFACDCTVYQACIPRFSLMGKSDPLRVCGNSLIACFEFYCICKYLQL